MRTVFSQKPERPSSCAFASVYFLKYTLYDMHEVDDRRSERAVASKNVWEFTCRF